MQLTAIGKILPSSKALFVMRITAFFLLLGLLQVSANTVAQVTLKETSAPLEKVLKAIKKQSAYDLFFNETLIKAKGKPVVVNVANVPVEEALAQVFKNQDQLTYTITGRIISIKEKKLEVVVNELVNPNPVSLPLTKDISGKITDADGNPLAGANIKIKGTLLGTSSNAEGIFILKGVDDNATIEISFVGYEAMSLKVKDRTSFIVSLKAKEESLQEVVVNKGYYTEKQKLSVSNVGRVTAKDIEKQPVTNPLLALQAMVPGLEITQDNGNPGSGVRFRIQGRTNLLNLTQSNPLIIIDGVPYPAQNLPTLQPGMLGNGILGGSVGDNISGGSTLSFINPSDIESIEVLKDADATAIYGSRAANGAILITTKRGKPGNMKVDMTMEQGWGRVPVKLDLLNTSQYLEMRMEAKRNNFASISATDYDINGLWDTTRYTDWQKELIGGTAYFTRASTSIAGGSSSANYRLGGTYSKETSVFPGNFADSKGSINVNLNGNDKNQRLQVSFSGSFMFDKNKLPGKDFTELIFLPPNAPALYKQDGTLNWAPDANGSSSWTNPLAYNQNLFDNTAYNLVTNISGSYKILPDLKIRANFGFNQLISDQFMGTLDAGIMPENRASLLRTGTTTHNLIRSWITEPQIDYSGLKLLGGTMEALLGVTFQEQVSEGLSVLAYGQSSDQMLRSLAAATGFNVVNYNSVYRYSGIYTRINYQAKERYLLNISARRDGSSRFGHNNLFSNFWGVGAGWIFSEEPLFKKHLPFINFAKIRGSYGLMGNDQIGDYQFMSLFSSPSYTLGDINYQGVRSMIGSLSNPDLQWEETRKLQLGLEIGAFQNRVLTNITYFRNRTGNSLGNVNMPIIAGANFLIMNFPALIENSGWELTINTENIKSKNFSWSSSLNLTIPRNKLVDFPDLKNSTSANSLVIGQPLGMSKTYSYFGIDPLSGQFLVHDNKGGLTITPNSATDQTVWLNRNQAIYGGLQNSLEFKGFQISFFLQYVYQKGFDFLQTGVSMPGVFQSFLPQQANQPVQVMNRWQKPGDQTNYARFSTTSVGFTPGDRGFKELPYLRLQNISLSYQLNAELLRRIKIKSCKIFAHARNLFTWTNYQGLNPESKSVSSIPPLRLITVGGNFGF